GPDEAHVERVRAGESPARRAEAAVVVQAVPAVRGIGVPLPGLGHRRLRRLRRRARGGRRGGFRDLASRLGYRSLSLRRLGRTALVGLAHRAEDRASPTPATEVAGDGDTGDGTGEGHR